MFEKKGLLKDQIFPLIGILLASPKAVPSRPWFEAPPGTSDSNVRRKENTPSTTLLYQTSSSPWLEGSEERKGLTLNWVSRCHFH